MEEDRSALITLEKIHEFNRRQVGREAVVCLGKLIRWSLLYSDNPRDAHPSKGLSDHRDNDRQCQPGIERATVIGNHHVVCVLHHKTVETPGSTRMVLTSHLYKYMTVFMQEMCSQLPDLDRLNKQTVFLFWC